MKIVRIEHEGGLRWARLVGEDVEVLAAGIALEESPRAVVEVTRPRSEVRLAAPLADGAKVLCVGLNYRDHVIEMGRELPAKPVLFTRFPDSLVGPEDELILPCESDKFDYEGEFTVVIGKGGRRIAAEDALSHVLGYTILNDGSLRDYQRHTIQFTPGKNFFASGSIGPWIVTAEEFGAVGRQSIRTSIDGEVRQDSTLDQLISDVSELIAYISSWTPLRPGDVIATGTPGGVADAFDPPKWMRAGQEVSVEIEGLGTLRNPVSADA